MVVKKDGKREHFYRDKLIAGLLKAAEKRPISTTQLETIADEVVVTVLDVEEQYYEAIGAIGPRVSDSDDGGA